MIIGKKNQIKLNIDNCRISDLFNDDNIENMTIELRRMHINKEGAKQIGIITVDPLGYFKSERIEYLSINDILRSKKIIVD